MKKEIKLTFCFCVTILTYATDAKSVLDFFEDRDRILELENGSYLGSDLELSTDEILANDHLMDHKVILFSIFFFNFSIFLFLFALFFFSFEFLSICLSVCLSFCLSVLLPICLSVCLSICLSVYLYICISVLLYICPSVYLSFCLSVLPSICVSVFLFFCILFITKC